MLAGNQYDYAMAYIDDIIEKGEDFSSSLTHLQEVFRRVRAAGLKLKPSKCELFRREITYLDHIISTEGMRTDPKKIQAIPDWPIPVYFTDVLGLSGLCGYYRKFIPQFGDLIKPMSALTIKTSDKTWREIHTESFDTLKQTLTSASLLAFPKHGCVYILDTDGSTRAIGAVLSQVQLNEKEERGATNSIREQAAFTSRAQLLHATKRVYRNKIVGTALQPLPGRPTLHCANGS